jgi:hypothetical protein
LSPKSLQCPPISAARLPVNEFMTRRVSRLPDVGSILPDDGLIDTPPNPRKFHLIEPPVYLSLLAKSTSSRTSSHQTITWEVIAAPPDLFDSRLVADQDCVRGRRSQRGITCRTIPFIQSLRRDKSNRLLNSCRRRLVFYQTFPQSLQIHRNSSTPS